MTYDLIVLGSGPAGLSAALGARGRGKSVLVIGNRWQDSPLAKAELVDNYLGMPHVTGAEMLERFTAQVAEAGAEFVTGRAVSLMAFDGFMVTEKPLRHQDVGTFPNKSRYKEFFLLLHLRNV